MNAQCSGRKVPPAGERDHARRRLHGIHHIYPMERKSGEKSWASISSGAKKDHGGQSSPAGDHLAGIRCVVAGEVAQILPQCPGLKDVQQHPDPLVRHQIIGDHQVAADG